MRLAFDVDDTLATGGKPYADCTPFPWVKERLQALKDQGHFLIIQTSRYMGQFHDDQVLATAWGKTELVEWLNKWEIPYDEVLLGKPNAHVFADNRGYRLESSLGEEEWDKFLSWLEEHKE